MRTALRIATESPLVRFDPDTRDYITRVERADGQALETGVRQAIDAFVRGCKADGIWGAIKASCILAGARTLSGALVPLKGTAPTNFNFVSGDYNRKTGLVGDGSTKYLNTNRANNADPQNNCHMAAHASTMTTNGTFLAAVGTPVTAGTNFIVGGTGNFIFSRCRSASGTSEGVFASTGMVGISRSASGSYSVRRVGATTTVSVASDGNESANILAYRRGDDASPTYSSHRLAFYSIGESLDLALLDARVTTLVNSIASSIDGVTDADARAYINAVENADGQALEVGVAQAYSAFITSCKSDGIWNAIKASCILAGARTLSGALVPLKGTAPTNFNFVSGDYNRKTGLVGNGSTKCLSTNLLASSLSSTSHHVFARGSGFETSSATTCNLGGVYVSPAIATLFDLPFVNGGTTRREFRSGTPGNSPGNTPSITTGLSVSGSVCGSRTSSTSLVLYQDGSSVATATNANTPTLPAIAFTVYARNNNGTPAEYTAARLNFFSFGDGLSGTSVALLDARVTTLVNTLSSVIP